MLADRWVCLRPIGFVRTCLVASAGGTLVFCRSFLLVSCLPGGRRLFLNRLFLVSGIAPVEGILQIVPPIGVYSVWPHGRLSTPRGTLVLLILHPPGLSGGRWPTSWSSLPLPVYICAQAWFRVKVPLYLYQRFRCRSPLWWVVAGPWLHCLATWPVRIICNRRKLHLRPSSSFCGVG